MEPPNVSAAPHLPAGILSPYRDGERGAVIRDFANYSGCKKVAVAAASSLLPVPIRGEAGR
ncbi:hypothetical protein EN851_31440 [Mesorhizobium sp. M8A.F.Ca.ET.208.01.1.1]|nr:hypothetical protein EN851_31440 [Mesorhizobium sp. M8A.F.Ca.ET.208.01.1.1]TGT47773.1 hypothetical protein EN810_31335 [Mesorhizobium sp. M8A.F.Ca.ET.167.01.1.1]